jgi:hypothetical protein
MKITALEKSANFATLDTEKLFSKLKSHELSRKGHLNHYASLTSKALIISTRIGSYDRVYKFSKYLYMLKQAPWIWYARLKTLLLEHVYVMENVDKIIFTLKHDNDFLLIQIYVDDIIFGDSSHVLVSNFQEIMEKEFQMSMIGELTFFLGIQVKQTKSGIFVHQVKYMKDLMKKFNMAEFKPVSTPMSMATVLDPDKNGKAVDQREYRSMISSLLYLTMTRPNI